MNAELENGKPRWDSISETNEAFIGWDPDQDTWVAKVSERRFYHEVRRGTQPGSGAWTDWDGIEVSLTLWCNHNII